MSKHRTREAAYKAAQALGEGDYVIFLGQERDREVEVSAEGGLRYRIPGAHNWHDWPGE